ncbi:MAG: DUF2892 domain-containing protein [Nanoarchaeota archaeon]
MKQNLSTLDRVLRFILAFWWLGPLQPQFETAWINIVIAVIAWIALVESFIGWCWIHTLLNMNDKKK